MIYIPGNRARVGSRVAFQRKPVPRIRVSEPNPAQISFLPEERPDSFPDPMLTFAPDEEALVSKLREYGVAERRARQLVKGRRKPVEEQLAAYPYRTLVETKKNPAGWLIAAIEYGDDGYPLPQLYMDAQQQKETKHKTAIRQQDEQVKRAREAKEHDARRRAEDRFAELPESERQRLVAESKAKLLAQPEWSQPKPSVIKALINSAARAAIIEDLMRE